MKFQKEPDIDRLVDEALTTKKFVFGREIKVRKQDNPLWQPLKQQLEFYSYEKKPDFPE